METSKDEYLFARWVGKRGRNVDFIILVLLKRKCTDAYSHTRGNCKTPWLPQNMEKNSLIFPLLTGTGDCDKSGLFITPSILWLHPLYFKEITILPS